MSNPEHERLRSRLKNTGKNSIEYRMTVIEARALLAEFDKSNEKVNETSIPDKEIVEVQNRILDGGTF